MRRFTAVSQMLRWKCPKTPYPIYAASHIHRGRQEGAGKKLYDPDGSLAHRYGFANKEGQVLIRPDGYIGFHSRAIVGEHLQRYLQNLFLIDSGMQKPGTN